MKRSFAYLPFLVLALLLGAASSIAQTTTGSLSGSVTDPKGDVVSGATVTLRNNATNQEFTTQTTGEGTFNVPALNSGIYTATITGRGFKQSMVTDIKIDVGKPSHINVSLEIGSAAETVTVVGGGELLQTQSPTIGTTLTGRQITDLPTASRDALDLVLAMPGTATPGRPRTSSVNGLPKGALNITIDGLNVQDNLLKSNDGFFTYIRPRTDAISEVTVSTSNPGAESSSEGAVQIKFVTQGGSNDYHGGLYWYHRNPALNANYWFNNRDLPPDPVTGKAPQSRQLLNQPGGKIGGPISIPKIFNGKDKAFFFVNYEEYRLAEKSPLRTRNILSSAAQSGVYRYFAAANVTPPANTTCVDATNPSTGAAAKLCSVNVFNVAATNANLKFANADPTISGLLSEIRGSLTGLTIRDTGDPNIQQVSFVNVNSQVRKFPTVRLDFNLSKNHHLENIWNYQQFRSPIDFLNNVDPAFPGFPNKGSQDSNRFSNSTAWRWTISNSLVNEARFGLLGGTSLFFANINPSQFQNQGGRSLGLNAFASGGFTLTNATVSTGPSRRNSPVKQFTDNLTWVKGNHSFNFGGSYTRVNLWSWAQTAVASAVFTTSSTLDPQPVNTFSFLPATQQAGAAQLYSLLSGRMTALNANARLSEKSNQYEYLGPQTARVQQYEWGIYAQDTWRFRPNLTFTAGLRFEHQDPFTALNSVQAFVPYSDLFGESGEGNLFAPGTLSGSHSTYTNFKEGDLAYKRRNGDFAPSVGVVYSPNFSSGFMRSLFGSSGQTVVRGGFSIAFVREGTQNFQAIIGSNPGISITTNRSLTLGNLPVNTYLREGPFAPPSFASAPVYPTNGLVTDSVNAFLPDLKIGKVSSWTVGIQRELTSNMVLEVRYIGNRGTDLWRQYDLNELNIVENGIYDEWKLAQQNLISNIACASTPGCTGGGVHFRYRGPNTGTSPLPMTLAYFTGQSAAALNPNLASSYTVSAASNFGSATYYNTMNPLNPSPLTFGSLLSSTAFDNRRTPVGQACFGIANCTGLGLFPYNHFFVNPGKRGGAFLIDNSGKTWYDALTVEFRRRLSKGLLIQSSYTFGKSLANTYASSSSVFDQPRTLRDFNLRKGTSPWDITHSFKGNFIYELPFGRGKTFLSDTSGWINQLLGGWGVNGNIRIQSGSPFSMGNVQLVGMDKKELQKAIGVYRESDGFVYVLPADIRENTVKAHNVAINTTGTLGPTYTLGAPSGRFIAPAGYGNCAQRFGFTPGASTAILGGDCGFSNLVLKGPAFFRSDLSLVKKIRFSERTNLELRGEFLNAFNNINFLVGAAANDLNTLGGFTSSAFGRMTAAYQDSSTTNDLGARMVQLVMRFNF